MNERPVNHPSRGGAIKATRLPINSDCCPYCGRDVPRKSDGALVWHRVRLGVTCDGTDRIA